MRIILQIIAGPETGRKVFLPSGQVARFGRTEWSDFAFPRDAAMAEVHFAVDSQRAGARLQDLGTPAGTFVNDAQVSQAELKHGDKIRAGGTTLQVWLGGDAGGLDEAVNIAAAEVAIEAAAAAAASQEITAQELAEHLELNAAAQAIAAQVKTPLELLARLTNETKFSAAVRVRAHLLPHQIAVWWGCLCVESGGLDELSANERRAHDAAHTWVLDPSEDNRRSCDAAAALTKFDGPGAWLSTAAFWTGSLAPLGMDPVPADARLTGQAVTSALLITAVRGNALAAPERYRAFLRLGDEVAEGKHKIPEKAGG